MRGKLFSGIGPSARFLFSHEGFSRAPLRCLLRTARWYLSVAIGQSPVLRIPEWNASFRLPCIFRSPAKVFYVFGRDYEYEIGFLESYLQAGDVFVDGGANFGLYTVLASRAIGDTGKVLAFEPFPASFKMAQANVDLNKLSNTELFQLALSDKTGEAELGVHDDPGRNSLSLDPDETVSKISIKKTTADDLWTETNLPLPTVLKLDVEGHELSILLGAREILEKSRPTVIFELNPPACERAGHSASALAGMLTNFGYSFFSFAEGHLYSATPECGDFVAIHASRMLEPRCQKLLAGL